MMLTVKITATITIDNEIMYGGTKDSEGGKWFFGILKNSKDLYIEDAGEIGDRIARIENIEVEKC